MSNLNDSDGAFSIEDDDECVIEDEENVVENTSGGIDIARDIVNSTSDDVISEQYVDDNEHHVGNDHIHDQLPCVEEVKSSQAYIPTALIIAKSNRRKLYAAFAGVIGLIIVSVIVVLSTKAIKKDHDKPMEENLHYS